MPAMPTLGITLADFEQLDGLVIVGGNLNEEVPLLAQRIRKAVKAGAKVFLVDVDPQEQIFDIAGVVRVEGADYAKTIQGWLNHPTNSSSEPLMTMLQSAPRKHILVAGALQQHPHYAAIYQTLVQLSEKLEATFGEVTPGANSAGLSLAGCLPHRAPGGKAVEREGLNAKELFEKPRKAYWFMGFEPEIDTLNPFASLMAVQSAELVVCVTPFVTPTMHQYADVILPMALPYETAGAYVTGTGQWQTVAPSINPPGEAKPAWKILRVLGNLFESPDFEYDNTQAVRAACRAQIEAVQCEPQSMTLSSEATSLSSSQVIAIPYLPHYGVDGILRRATALQQTTLAQVAKTVRLSEDVANRYGLTDGQMAKVIAQRQTEGLCLSVLIDDKLPANTAVVPWGLQESVVLGAPYQPVEIQPA
jgi:NADH-quinone oxidoreductase subunit G